MNDTTSVPLGDGPLHSSTAPRSRRGRRPGRARATGFVVAAGLIGAGLTLAVPAGPASAATRHPAASPMVLIKTATVAKYGKILVDQQGLALYYDTANKPSHWACTGKCLGAWPAVVVPKGETLAQLGRALTSGASNLGTVSSPSGRQVTWDGKALYTFIKDTKGTVYGQGIGKVWYVAKLSGTSSGGTGGVAF